MAETDRARWDRKYTAGEGPAHFQPHAFLTAHRALLGGGRALDAACGWGGSALYLASLGYQVEGVDASGVALARAQEEARRRGLALSLVQADLTRWLLPPARYDLILVLCYLNRSLMAQAARALRPGGLLFQVNRNMDYRTERPDFSPDYLLEPGELRRLAEAAGLELLSYADGTPADPALTQMIARQPVTD